MNERFRGEGFTFDDILLIPAYSTVAPADVDVSTRLTRGIRLNIPIVSAPMDTVTESRLAIAMAQEGGMGVIHRNLSVDDQVKEVMRVKRAASSVVRDPITMGPRDTIGQVRATMATHGISGIPIVEPDGRLVGIITARDLRFQHDASTLVEKVMTKGRLVTAEVDTNLDQAKAILDKAKVEKLLLVDKAHKLQGLITVRDIDRVSQYPNAAKDEQGRLRVGAAVGVDDEARVAALVAADVDVIVVDTAHGHSKRVLDTVKAIKKKHKTQVIAGNIATKDAAKALMDAGADGLRVGVGPGSICTTRIVAGVGVPQVSAIMEAAEAVAGTDVPVLGDGGIKFSGDITKALAAGAHTVMCGNLFAGTEEAPGTMVIYRGRTYKSYRGMGSMGALMSGSVRYEQPGRGTGKLVPEGIEGRVPYKGSLREYVYQMVGGLKSGMGYVGAENIEQLRTRTQFMRVTHASMIESHPHDVTITQEAPNYRVGSIDE
jgi:IMP dehydrogenase